MATREPEELTEAQAAYKRGEECQTLPEIYTRFDEMGIGGEHWKNEVFASEVWAAYPITWPSSPGGGNNNERRNFGYYTLNISPSSKM